VCGDFGYWPEFDNSTVLGKVRYGLDGRVIKKREKWFLKGIKTQGSIVRFCDGNHEDHWNLAKLEFPVIYENVVYMKRGTVSALPDGRNVLWIGGAESIDKKLRTIGVDWFPEEVLTQGDVYRLPDVRIDIVISHTCPEEFLSEMLPHDPRKINDPSNKALSYVLEKYRPDLWYFAHWHWYKTGYDKGCRWTCLNMAGESGWWEVLR